MKKKVERGDNQEVEILKAVAQAWRHGHSGNSRPTNEFDARRTNFKSRPSRFKLEAMKNLWGKDNGGANWDFGESLLDAYEIVTVSKRLEAGLVLDNPVSGLDDSSRLVKRRKESKNSLLNLINTMSSRRFNEAQVRRVCDDQF